MGRSIPHPYRAPANPVTFYRVLSKDPFGYTKADNGEHTNFAKNSALLYNYRDDTIHDNLLEVLRGGLFGEGVDYIKYANSNVVTLDETTPVDHNSLTPSHLYRCPQHTRRIFQ